MKLAADVTEVLRETAAALRGSDRRLFMARTVRDLFDEVMNRAVRALDGDERTLREGKNELRSGIECPDGGSGGGHPTAQAPLPNLVRDLRDLVDGQSQTDPRFQTQRPYTRITSAEVRRHLILQKGCMDQELPCEETIRVKLNELGHGLRAVAKTKPKESCFDRPTRSSSR